MPTPFSPAPPAFYDTQTQDEWRALPRDRQVRVLRLAETEGPTTSSLILAATNGLRRLAERDRDLAALAAPHWTSSPRTV